ncbi:MAG: SHOCT domain-containing protein [Chloroflexota bacterium]
MSGHADRPQPVRLPGGAPLAPDEAPLVGDRFMLSTIAFYLHTELVLTNRRLYAVRPNTLFGLIPIGTARSNFPIENIAGVTAGTRFDILGVLIGGLGVLVGFVALAAPSIAIFGVLLVVIGLLLILGAPKQAIEVMNSGGGTIPFRVSVLERSRTVEFANLVSEAIARSTARGSQAAGSPILQPARGSDPTEALGQLSRMRELGLVTEAEYETKRAEILGRL